MAGYEVLPWDDFSAGIYRGREAPAGAVYDAENALVDDEGQLFKRGVSAYYSASAAAQSFRQMWSLFMRGPAANRVLARGSSILYALDGSLAPAEVQSGIGALTRPASFGDFAVFALGVKSLMIYGGSRKTANYSTGTLTATAGSVTVTGVGTSWLANVDAGMLLEVGGDYAVVKAVASDTSLTLASPWPYATAAGSAYLMTRLANLSYASLPSFGAKSYVAAGSGLLLMSIGNRVYFLSGTDLSFGVNDYHELPANVSIVGIESRGTSAWVFTTGGVWEIQNLYLDAVDDFGNIQRPVEQVNKDLVLWGDDGIAAWDSAVVVPAIDDVYLADGGFEVTPISRGIRSLYRGYVKAGYSPGLASVHRGHYFLPIMDGTTLVTTLVCRLDRPVLDGQIFPWVRWSGHAAGAAYATLIEEAAREPKLLGINAARVSNLSGCMEVSGASTQDADSTTPVFRVDSSDFDLGGGVYSGTATIWRLVYETAGGTPVLEAHSAIGAEGASFSAGTLKVGGGASDGTDYSSWRFDRRAERIRVRVECESAVQKLILRRGALTVRPSGRG